MERHVSVSRATLDRHRRAHTAAVQQAVARRAGAIVARSEAQHAESVVDLLRAGYRRATDLERQALRLATVAEDAGHIGIALAGVGEARQALGEQRQHLTVVGKATGEIAGAEVEVRIDFGGGEVRGRADEAVRMLARIGAWLRDRHPELVDEARAALGSGE